MDEKMVLIGAGSAMFTRGLVADMIRSGVKAELSLVDIDPQALEVAQRMAEKMVQARQAPIRIRAAVDRRQVLPGSTVVVTTIGVGGRRAWEQDVFIPRKYGIYMPVGDTTGPGGTSRALRMIPAMVEITRDVLDLAPQALYFNYANPMAVVCRAVHKATGARMTGLCIGVFEVHHYLAGVLGVDPADFQFQAVGINHMTWFYDMKVKGQDIHPRLHQIAAQRLAAAPAADIPVVEGRDAPRPVPPDGSAVASDNPFSWKLFQVFDAFPAVLDRHVSEFYPQFFREGVYYGRRLGVAENAFSFENTIYWGDKIYEEMRAEAFNPAPLAPDYLDRVGGEHEQLMEILDSIRNDRGKRFSANLPNTGQAPNLPLGLVVEGPAIADAHGVRPVAVSPLPSGLVGTLATRFQWVEVTAEAALEGSREKFLQALVLDGAVRSIDQAEQLADELLAAHRQYLPQFKGEG